MDATPLSLLRRLNEPAAQDAWRRLVDLYTPYLYKWACQAGLRDADASDLVQDVLTILVRKLPEFQHDGAGSFRAWLKAVTLNKWRDLYRKRASLANPGPLPRADEIVAPDESSFTEEEHRRHLVARAMQIMQADFQPTTWKACWAFVVEDRSADDIARELGLTRKAVYVAKARVMRRLRQELAGLLD